MIQSHVRTKQVAPIAASPAEGKHQYVPVKATLPHHQPQASHTCFSWSCISGGMLLMVLAGLASIAMRRSGALRPSSSSAARSRPAQNPKILGPCFSLDGRACSATTLDLTSHTQHAPLAQPVHAMQRKLACISWGPTSSLINAIPQRQAGHQATRAGGSSSAYCLACCCRCCLVGRCQPYLTRGQQISGSAVSWWPGCQQRPAFRLCQSRRVATKILLSGGSCTSNTATLGSLPRTLSAAPTCRICCVVASLRSVPSAFSSSSRSNACAAGRRSDSSWFSTTGMPARPGERGRHTRAVCATHGPPLFHSCQLRAVAAVVNSGGSVGLLTC